MNKSFFKSYGSAFLWSGLLVVGLLIVCGWILLQGMVHSNQTSVSLLEILKNPTLLTRLRKSEPIFNFVDADELAFSDQVHVICVPECVIVLGVVDIQTAESFVSLPIEEEPKQVIDNHQKQFWIIPARALAADAVYATKLGNVIWDSTRSTIVYEVESTTLEEDHHQVYVWQYSMDWAMGLKHWFKLKTAQNDYFISGYDPDQGYIEISDKLQNSQPVFGFSVSDPILIDL